MRLANVTFDTEMLELGLPLPLMDKELASLSRPLYLLLRLTVILSRLIVIAFGVSQIVGSKIKRLVRPSI